MKIVCSLVFCGLFAGCLASGQHPVWPAINSRNGAFLSRKFLSDPKTVAALTDDFVSKADKLYGITLLFPNGGLLGSSGALDHAPYAAATFLGHVNAYESANGVTFTLMPYLNGYSLQDTVHGANLRLDLSNQGVRMQIIAECERYVSDSVPGSYVKGLGRAFDGILLDIEPAGDPAFFASFKVLLREVRASFDGLGLTSKKIAVATPQYTARVPKPDWGWNSSDYYYVAKYVDYVVAMTYDSGINDASQYHKWMRDQTTTILRAVSGDTWSFDEAHPQPQNGVKVVIGFPGFYTSTQAHNPEIENVRNAAPGVLDGLSFLPSICPICASYFQGVTMFAHDDGSPDSIYARYDSDWSWWEKYWQGK